MADDLVEKYARDIADSVKNGEGGEVRRKLSEDFSELRSRKQFENLLTAIQQDNAKDRTVDKYLPGFELDTTPFRTIPFITTPGKVFGNLWRDTWPVEKYEK
jgi:hypothetical protein